MKWEEEHRKKGVNGSGRNAKKGWEGSKGCEKGGVK